MSQVWAAPEAHLPSLHRELAPLLPTEDRVAGMAAKPVSLGLTEAWQGCCPVIPLTTQPDWTGSEGKQLNSLCWLPFSFVTDELSDVWGS